MVYPRFLSSAYTGLKMALLCGFCAAICQGGQIGPSRNPADARTEKYTQQYTQQGVVVNSVSGEPIPYAFVQITNLAPHRAVFADAEGKFQFSDLQAGELAFEVNKPGFHQERGPNAPYALRNSADSSPIKLALCPEAVIAGHVADVNGDPIEGAAVRVMVSTVYAGRRSWNSLPLVTTDDEGDFRIADLKPGRYVVGVEANWTTSANLIGSRQAYPSVVYHSGSTDRIASAPLELKAGQHIDLEFAERPEPAFQVSGSVEGYSKDDNVNITILNQLGDELVLPTNYDRLSSTFTIGKIAAGTYVIRAAGPSGDGETLLAESTVNVSHDLAGLKLIAQRGITIPVIVQQHGVEEPPSGAATVYRKWIGAPLSISLERTAQGSNSGVVIAESAQDPAVLMLKNVTPGTYAVSMQPENGYIQSATCGNIDLLRQDLVIPPGTSVPAIEVVISGDSGRVTVSALDTEVGRAIRILMVSDATGRPAMIQDARREASVINGLAPGSYKVFAFEDLEQIEYMNPEVLDRYMSKASEVTVSPNGNATVAVNVIKAEEP